MTMTPIQVLIRNLNPDEVVELEQVAAYLSEHTDGSNPHAMPEGTVAQVLNRCSPRVRDALDTLSKTLDTPRTLPFQTKLSQDQIAETIGLDPRTTSAVKQKMFDEDIAAGLQRRLGTDSAEQYGKPLPPPTDRELIETAVAAHGGTDIQDFLPEMANAADGRSLRDTLSIITDYTT
jgi:hypothetical protein